jgi:hypothetical protein
MKYLARLIGVGSFLVMLVNFFLPWFDVEGAYISSILGNVLSPISIFSKFANLEPNNFMIFLFFLTPVLFVYLGAVYCIFNPYKGGVICLVALSFLTTLLTVYYYTTNTDLVVILTAVLQSIRIGFLVILLVSIITITTGFFTKGVHRRVRREAFTIYTGED